jgi:hypothetical protein
MTEHPYDPFEQSLLASAKGDAMSPDRKRTLAAALAGGAMAATTAATGTAVAAKAKSSVALVVLKWVGTGVVGSALVAGATKGVVMYREHASELHSVPARVRVPSSPPNAPAPAPLLEPAAAPEAPLPAMQEGSPAVAAIPPVASSAPATSPAAAPVRRAAGSSTPTLADELQLIERARTSLAADDVVSAERALDAHALTFSSGVFAEEARVLRIDVMARRGDHARARAAARIFLAAHPDSPYAPRLRALIGEGGGG